ncbi:MAG: exodeoxyribonuclease VII large subunit [Verrucomicrobia bacterium]|nr:exodeoxyribonuclease VII large subunit [Verrucomicrobiota bacterium]NDD56953.1 exodeoxyribonuclease VII large subunit [Verrucomicrobiota bacterium]
MSRPEPLSVSALTARIKDLLEEQVGEVSVAGEISNFRRQASGHCYFTLKDEGSQIPCALFKGSAARLGLQPADGVKVVAHGEVSVYEPRGAYQLIVRGLEPLGKGDLHQRFEELKRKLQAEGLFAEERKRPLPEFVERIGIVTSPTGAAVRDVVHVLQRRCPRIALTVFGVKVQGDGAAEEVAEAIRRLGEMDFDLLMVVRGGGSLEDLWSFNEEIVARAVVSCPIPVISGVGHETDFTICDFVADLRAPTPSAAAEMASRPDAEWGEEIVGLQERLKSGVADLFEEKKRRLAELGSSYVFREPRRMVELSAQRVDELGIQLQRALGNAWRHRKQMAVALLQRWMALRPERNVAELALRLKGATDRLRALGPEETLRRGYTLVQSPDGKLIRAVESARKQGDLVVRFSDGKLPVVVRKA